jgi:hypothetical protein
MYLSSSVGVFSDCGTFSSFIGWSFLFENQKILLLAYIEREKNWWTAFIYLWCFQIEKYASIPCLALRYESHWLSCFFWYNLASINYMWVFSIEWNRRNFYISSNGTTYWVCDLERHCNLVIWDKLHLC